MNLRSLLPVAVLLSGFALLTGCSTFDQNELGIIRGSGVTPRVYDKMERGREITPEDVIEMTRKHVPSRYIVRQVEDIGLDYVLSPEDVKKMEKARVSRDVVDTMIAASDEFASRYGGSRRSVTFYSGVDPYFYDDYDYGYYGPSYGYYRRPYPVGGTIGIGIVPGHRHWRR